MNNPMSKRTWALLGLTILAVPSVLLADKDTLGVSSAKPSPALVESVQRDCKDLEMRKVIEALDGQLIDAINASRKFELISRSDLKQVHAEQEYANSGNVDPNDKSAAKQFKE